MTELYERLLASGEGNIIHSIELIESMFTQYGLSGVALSFNGGKDCTVVLYLVQAVMAHMGLPLSELKVIYFVNQGDFRDTIEFMKTVGKRLGFRTEFVDEMDFRTGVARILETNPALKVFLMGQRKNDPHGYKIEELSPSDSGWPVFLRCNPILHWSYNQVWSFLRDFQLDYCKLYDQGYTSLGSHNSTGRNEKLKRGDDNYAPAWSLEDGKQERSGRTA